MRSLKALGVIVGMLALALGCGAAATTPQLEGRATQAFKEFRWWFDAQKMPTGMPLSSLWHDDHAARAVYGYVMAPFLRPELSAREIEGLTMAQFLPQGFESVPTVEQLKQALFRAATADPRTLTKAQAELAGVLKRPESNELVFHIAKADILKHCDEQGRCFREGSEYLGRGFYNMYAGEFGKFQSQNPKESLLQAIADGRVPWLLSEEDRAKLECIEEVNRYRRGVGLPPLNPDGSFPDGSPSRCRSGGR
jgi:hypothetical protein